MDVPLPVDPATVPTLSGVFAPVPDERDAVDLVVRGELPEDLRGAFVRNGPNPLFPPLGSYTFPLEGDAMLHGVWIDDDGSVRYRNRFVWTPQLRIERDAGHALWAGLMTPYLPGPDVVPEPYANGYKDMPFINIIHHGGRWLALSEVDPPYEVTADLEVVGDHPFTWGGAIGGMSPHPRVDPATGELVLFRYDFEEPYLMWAVVGADGSVTQAPAPVDVDTTYMVHDFVLTEHFVVLFVAPAVFDLNAIITGDGPPLSWDRARPERIAIIPRDGSGATRWVETDPFWAYHFANGYEDGQEIVVDFAKFTMFALGHEPDQRGATTRARIDRQKGTVTLEDFDDRFAEFPRIDDRLQTRPHRFFAVSTKDDDVPTFHWNRLLRIDTETGTTVEWSSGTKHFNEVVYAPAEGSAPNTGYYVTFRTDIETLESDWVVLDADDIAAGPIATVELPFRIPAGLHGNWFSREQLT